MNKMWWVLGGHTQPELKQNKVKQSKAEKRQSNKKKTENRERTHCNPLVPFTIVTWWWSSSSKVIACSLTIIANKQSVCGVRVSFIFGSIGTENGPINWPIHGACAAFARLWMHELAYTQPMSHKLSVRLSIFVCLRKRDRAIAARNPISQTWETDMQPGYTARKTEKKSERQSERAFDRVGW